ncbi:hypothetical protein F5Y19DRAFT_96026 [Xylariaceae sp. FL1651]|nr:hypothetical protein F5Y19DRAFT_96026 [Xylariaceae sp. FL1651]
MAANAHNRSTYQCYPYLTGEEFAEVCHYLDRKYCQATLGPIRQEWRLSLHTALDTSATSHADLVTFLQITKSLEDTVVEHQLTSRLSSIVLDEPSAPNQLSPQGSMADDNMVEMEEADKEIFLRQSSNASFQSSYVVYEIHLHPTYRAPCLWFSLHNLSTDESPLNVETVLRLLVPDIFKHSLRGQGAIGGISIEHHPITSVPTFFIHPCFLGDTMARFDCSKEDYLMVWLGLVGGCVGLWVPKQMATLGQT